MIALITSGTLPPARYWASRALLVIPSASPRPACTAMIFARTITCGDTLRKVMPSRSKMPIPARVIFDWIQSRK